MTGLEGKRAIVTGGSSGIGAATAKALAEAGVTVVSGSRRDGTLDVTDDASCRRFVDDALGRLGGLEILVNNAGLSRGRDPVWESKEADEHQVIATNVLGLMRMTRLCVPHLVDSGAGHIVNLGSVAGIWSYANGSSYVASKFAVHGYTRALRDDLQGKPVRITNVAPGLVETDFSRVRFGGDEEKARGGLLERRDGRAAPPGRRRRLDPVRAQPAGERERRRDRADRPCADVGRQHPARVVNAAVFHTIGTDLCQVL